MLFILCWLSLQVAAQLGTNVSLLHGVTTNIFSVKTVPITSDSSSPSYPNDYFIRVVFTSTQVLTLASSNIIQVYNKSNLTQPIQIFTNYSYSHHLPYTLKDLAVD
jgi:hypothetical protein